MAAIPHSLGIFKAFDVVITESYGLYRMGTVLCPRGVKLLTANGAQKSIAHPSFLMHLVAFSTSSPGTHPNIHPFHALCF